jgi:hypothetical protein
METEIKMLYIIEALIIYDIMKFLIGLTISLLMPTQTTKFSTKVMTLDEFEEEMKKLDKENKDE